MIVLKTIFGITCLIPFIALMLIYLVFALLVAVIFSIAECFIKDGQSHGRNNLNRFENVANNFLDAFKNYFQVMFVGKR